MDKTITDQNLSTLKELLLDERKLVTYVSLSKEMCIHVNESKSLLKQIVEYLKKKEPDVRLNVNYIISGLLDDNRAQTIVCNETDFEEIKNKLKVIFYHHLYSVNVGPPLVDNVLFMALNNFSDFPLCAGLIKSNSCVKRSLDEIGSLKTNGQDDVPIEHKPSISGQRVPKEVKKSASNGVSEVKEVMKIKETKSEPTIKTETISPKKESVSTNLQNSERKNVPKSQKGIAGFFNKSSAVPAKKMENGIKENVMKTKLKKETQITDSTKVKTEKMDVDEVVSVKANKELIKKEVVKEAREKNKTLNTIKKNAKVDKKRKRVLHVSDSESEDEKSDPFREEPVPDQDSEDEIPPTPLVNTVKITSGILNPKKKRKIVDKTYTDEDGYILTKKEEVYESCSENEDEISVKENAQQVNKVEIKVKAEVSPPEKNNGNKSGKKKIASPQKGKQATLMSFFKKVPQK